jgi:inhibitor of KinA sporulation pathway (predicted exonuclease)
MKHIAILDLELTAWEGSLRRRWSGPNEEPEVVQLGAVKLTDDQTLSEVAALEVLVKPTINPTLSDYFTDLTGISQTDVDSMGISFPECLDRFVDFLGDDAKAIYFFGIDHEILQRNCELSGIDLRVDDRLFIDAHSMMVEKMGRAYKSVISSQLPDVLGFAAPGAAHQSLSDCRCIAEAFRIWREQGIF